MVAAQSHNVGEFMRTGKYDHKTSHGRRLVVPDKDQLLKVVGKQKGYVEGLRH